MSCMRHVGARLAGATRAYSLMLLSSRHRSRRSFCIALRRFSSAACSASTAARPSSCRLMLASVSPKLCRTIRLIYDTIWPPQSAAIELCRHLNGKHDDNAIDLSCHMNC